MEVSGAGAHRKKEEQDAMATKNEEHGENIVKILSDETNQPKERTPTTTTIVLGSFEEALSTDCPRHKPLIERFVEYCQQSEIPRPPGWEPNDLGILFKSGRTEISESVSKLGWCKSLVLADKSPPSVDNVRKGRIVDPEYMDLDILKHWKGQCLTSHGARCQNPMKIWRTHPAWLVDVQKRCVVPGDDPAAASVPFVALSYCWGTRAHISLVPESMPGLQRPGALDDDNYSGWISPIIRHAIYLTSVLGERYLWADSLCIVHGDSTTAEQLGLMGAIYASALVVIIAADGDAQEGIAGLKRIPGSQPRNSQQWLIPFGDDETIIARPNSPFTLSQGGKYYERGWTYQEHKMASRKLFIKDGLAHWECKSCQWHEDLVQGVELDKYIDPRLRGILAGFPILSSLSHIVGNYNELNLRYEEDTLPGIMGLLSVLSRSFDGGFLYGLPETCFDRALGWRPHWPHSTLTRREISGRPKHLKYSSALPSWSWVGWKGLVTLGEEAVQINHRSSAISETFPITRWLTSESPTTAPHARREIRSGWYKQRSAWKRNAANLSSPLPTGWTRLEVEAGSTSTFRNQPLLWPEDCEGYVYKHRNLPGDNYGPTDTFFYPFPVPEITESTPPSMPEQTAYLFCTTQRARLWTCGKKVVDPRYPETYSSLCIIIHDATGEDVGELQLPDHEQLKWIIDASESLELGIQVDLVAINRVLTRGNTFIEEEQRRGLPQWNRDVYTVLWVEWTDGVAHRIAVGSVEELKWEKLGLEEIDLVLG